ncbi:MazG nucleotide pyrophosphohydrolase domain-containing protein [Corynebacterium aquilae]|uniref:MazG nucleotide pyrophosphohydrolase domain-containing protein n=1 Tax=Corynebacterium aquilae TaxID=203263 RepID=UPI000952E61E|nr:MazG nucleotide pyrophosphohydrolase domain-containing protein [Corynebacterium aquilae]
MSVVLLDPRCPDTIPVDAIAVLRGEIRYTDEVGVHVRWVVGDIAARAAALPPAVGVAADEPVLVSSNEDDPLVREALARGEKLYAAASRGQEVIPERLRAIDEAMAVMRRALEIGQWERSQTHQSLIPYLREETEELIEAIENQAGGAGMSREAELRDELSDVLLQVLFHAQIAQERGAFDFGSVADAFVAKMRARAPYLFDGTTEIVSIEEQQRLWEESKKPAFDPLTADSSLLPPLVGLGELQLPKEPTLD